jgi:hypothetical protein
VNNIETILVILLSVGFIVLLTLSIILTTVLIGILKNVRRISEKAEEAAENMSDITAMVGRRVAPIAVSSVIAAVMNRFKDRGKSKK